MTEPISPDKVYEVTQPFPPEVFQAFNELIARDFDGHSAIVNQTEVANLIASYLGISSREVYSKKYLDIENSYRGKGWKVYYDRPAYNESYVATFKFTKP